MFARHEEIRRQKQGAEKSVIVGFPAERTTSVEIRHTHARRNPSSPLWPVTSACADVPTDQHPIWSDLSFLRISFRHVFSKFVWHQHLRCLKSFVASKRCLQKHHYHLQTQRRKTGDSACLLQLVLTDNDRHVEHELWFFLGIARLEERSAHAMVNP